MLSDQIVVFGDRGSITAVRPATASKLPDLDFDIYNDDFVWQESAKAHMLPESIEKERKIGRLQRENFRHAWESGTKKLLPPTPAFILRATTLGNSQKWWSGA